jgi:hypothetical protein
MRKNLKYISSMLVSEETGQALILVLVFVLLGSLTLLPTLAHMSTALKTGVIYENKTNELFTADAGIENGLWRIKYDSLGPTYDVYDYSTVWSYQTDPVNNRAAGVTIRNVWIPTNITLASLGITPAQAKTMVDSEKLVVTGTSGGSPGQPYHIKIEFTPATGDNLTVKSIGIWLPQGFTYTVHSSALEAGGPFTDYYPDSVSVAAVPGGQSVVWSYNSPYPLFTALPNFVSENGTLTSTITFSYSPPADNPNKLPVAIAWMTTGGVASVPIAWDTDTRIYKITSSTGNTQIETYSSKSQLRKLGDAIAGDYVAIGNSLMIGNVEKRDQWLPSSDNILTAIPSDADVISAILYWSGFRHDTSVFSDGCSNFDNWDRSSEDGSQIRVPTSDGDINGTWNTSPCWDDVDETTPNETDYMTGTTDAGGYKLFNFSPFSIPDLPIADLTVYVGARDASSGHHNNNDIRPSIKVNGTIYNADSGDDPGNNFDTYSYSYTTNPKTGLAWVAADINGTGAHPLQQFGVDSSDLNPDIDVTMVYAQVNYLSDSRWTLSSGQFQGQGSSSATTASRTLTLKNSANLSSYAPGTIAVAWDQDEGGTLEPGDTLYFALSGDGGNSWSSNIEAFHDDNPHSPFYYIIPDGYMTSSFKIRFYFNFDDSAEYVYLDNFKILNLPPDTSITFKINDQQVYLDANGDPQAGVQPLTASSSSVLVNTAGTDSPGFSYACHRDVSKLVKKYPIVPGEPHHTGNFKYTVGDVSADTGEYVSYAGWSMIIIYSSPETAGHYLYLRDVFAFNPGSANLDFDGDGVAGGDISNFVIPEPIKNKYGVITETGAAKVTCFVGEGDEIYSGDTLVIKGQQSAASKYLSNSASPWNNVWNSASPGVSYPGIDVDTFQLLWSDNILTPGDTRLHLDMNTGTDAWNLIYVILSVRSETVTGGTENYVISGSP